MNYGSHRVSAGTAFFHGTCRTSAVVREGVRTSNATPGGSALTGFAWFFASHAPALGYCVCDYTIDTPSVVEFALRGDLELADFRGRGLPMWPPQGSSWAAQLQSAGLGGVVIESTTGRSDYEYGFLRPADLDFVRYRAMSKTDLRTNLWWERYCTLGKEEASAFENQVEVLAAGIESRILQTMAGCSP